MYTLQGSRADVFCAGSKPSTVDCVVDFDLVIDVMEISKLCYWVEVAGQLRVMLFLPAWPADMLLLLLLLVLCTRVLWTQTLC